MKNRTILLNEIQNTLGIKFNNIYFLDTALTHSSFANQKKEVQFNERLEFLGDSVLQLIISEFLYNNYKNKNEGDLTKLRSLIVCENSLHEIARTWNLGSYINMSKGEELTGGRNRVSIMADAVEAIIAAIYMDQGFQSAKEFILRNFRNVIDKAIKNEIVLDYKTKLQEVLQKNGEVDIEYNVLNFEGPPHRRTFFVEALIDGNSLGRGQGFSKKEAEQNAAKSTLITLEGKNE